MKKVAYFAKEASFLLLYGKKYIFFIKDVVWLLIDFHWFAGKPIKQKSEETYLAFRSFDSFQRKNTWNERWLLININYWEQRKGSERNTPEIFGVIAGEQNENKMCLSQGLC